MTRAEFAEVMAYLQSGCGKSLTAHAVEVYFDLLNDIPVVVFRTAARRVLLEHPWSTFPSVAELRKAAVETMRGEVSPITGAEAWEMAWRAAGRIDLEQPGSAERHMQALPQIVQSAMRGFGLASLCSGGEPVSVVRSQFLKLFEGLSKRIERAGLFPPHVQEAVRQQLPKPVEVVMGQIGQKA